MAYHNHDLEGAVEAIARDVFDDEFANGDGFVSQEGFDELVDEVKDLKEELDELKAALAQTNKICTAISELFTQFASIAVRLSSDENSGSANSATASEKASDTDSVVFRVS